LQVAPSAYELSQEPDNHLQGKGLPALLELKENKDPKKTLEQILDELDEEDKRLGYSDLLGQFEDAPADFFDGRNGLFVKTTEVGYFPTRMPLLNPFKNLVCKSLFRFDTLWP
jgi:hypothetical protein